MFDIDDIRQTQAYLLSEAEEIRGNFRVSDTYNNKILLKSVMCASLNNEIMGGASGSLVTFSQAKKNDFLDLPDAFTTHCQPQIKVYKTYIDDDGTEHDYLLPMGEYLGRRVNGNGTEVETTRGVVVKSVEFTRLGGNPAEIDTNIKFNLKLFAQDITTFFVKNETSPVIPYTPQASSDLISARVERDDMLDLIEAASVSGSGVSQGRRDSYDVRLETIGNRIHELAKSETNVGANGERRSAWIDLIKIDPSQPLNDGEGDAALVTSENQVRIKVEIGYATPNTKPINYSGNDWQEWAEVIGNQKEVFYLSLFKHQFDFRGYDGVDLSIDFIASANATKLSPDADLFNNPEIEGQIKAILAILRNKEEQLELAQAQEDTTSVTETCIEELNDSIQEYESVVRSINSKNKLRILSQIYLFGDVPDAQGNTRHFSRIYTRSYQMLDEDSTIKNRQRKPAYHLRPRPQGGSVNLEGNEGLNVADVDLGAIDQSQTNDEEDEVSLTAFTAKDGDNMRAADHFIFLGDIIDAALELLVPGEGMGNVTTQYATNTGFGNITGWDRWKDEYEYDREFHQPIYFDGAGSSQSRNQRKQDIINKFGVFISGWVTYKDPNNITENITIPIRDIPISLDIFRSWWMNNYVKSGRKTLGLKDFIVQLLKFVERDVFKDIPLEHGNNEDNIDTPKFIINYAMTDRTSAERFYRLNSSWVSPNEIAAATWSPETNGIPALLIEQSNNNPRWNSLTATITFGETNKGILKGVTFEREDIPGHAEARLFSDRTSVAGNIALREKYNTKLDLIGTTSLAPGSLFYLDPLPLDLGWSQTERTSFARQLGLGGMYRVVNLTSAINFDSSGNTWETTVNTKWESFGDGQNGVTAVAQEEEDAGICAEREEAAATVLAAEEAAAQALRDIVTEHNARIAAEREAETQRLEAIADSELVSVSEAQDASASARTRRRGERAARRRQMRDEGLVVDCFVPDTKVSMYDGTIKEIKDIIKGDIVLSYKDGDYTKGVVSHVAYLPQNGIRPVAKLGDLVCSPTHPIYYNGQWKEIKDSDAPVSIVEEYVDAYYLLEIDSHDVYGSEHNFIADGYIMSGLGNNVTLNAAFQRQPKWNDENREEFLKKRMALGPLQSSEGI